MPPCALHTSGVHSVERVESLDDYKSLVRENKSRLGKAVTNCRLLSSAFLGPIGDGRLFWERVPNGLVFLVDEGGYLNVYYHVQEGTALPSLNTGRVLLVEEVVRSGARPSQLVASSGFLCVRRNLQYSLTCDNMAGKGDTQDVDGYRIARCTDDAMASQVVSLWEEGLGAFDVPADHRDFLAQGDTVLCAVDKNDELAGAYWWHDAGRTRNARHVVVAENHRRKGVAQALVRSCARDAAQAGMLRVLTWISEDNAASISLHVGVGYKPTGQQIWQYKRDERHLDGRDFGNP